MSDVIVIISSVLCPVPALSDFHIEWIVAFLFPLQVVTFVSYHPFARQGSKCLLFLWLCSRSVYTFLVSWLRFVCVLSWRYT